MNEQAPPTTTKPDFFISDYFTIFISSEPALWIYGNGIMSIGKHTPRVRIAEITPLERVPKSYKKARFPINGTDNGKGHFSMYSSGYAVDVPVNHPDSMINDLYVKQKIEEHYTYNYPPTTTTP
jgi:hypothetical protein